MYRKQYRHPVNRQKPTLFHDHHADSLPGQLNLLIEAPWEADDAASNPLLDISIEDCGENLQGRENPGE